MPKIHDVIVQVRAPSGRPHDYGQATSGFYTIDDDRRLTMTDESGTPVRRRNGELWTHLLSADDNPDLIARILTKQIRAGLHGDSAGFHRRIVY